MTVADDIVDLVTRKRRLRLTEEDIADMLFGQNHGYQQRVNADCRLLVQRGLLVRLGNGGPASPYTYALPPIKRRKIED
jgi:hypothetical protein